MGSHFKKYKLKAKPREVANALHIYARLLTYVRKYWFALILAAFGSMLYSGIDAWFISFLKPLLNKGVFAKNYNYLKLAPFIVMGVFIIRGIASFLSNYYIALASRNVIMQLRQDLFAHMQKLPAKFFDHTTSGQVLSVLLYSVDQVANASADVITTAVQAIFLIIGLLIVMFTTSWKLSLLYFAIFPLVAVIMRISSLRIRRLSLSVQDTVGEISHCAEENIEGYKVVRAFEGQEYEIDKFTKATRNNRHREMKIVTTRSISISIVQFVMAAALAITLYIATLDIAGSILTAGGFVSIVAAMLALLKPMKDLSNVQNKLYKGLAGAQSVFELMDEAIEEDKGTRTIERAKGDIAFNHVSFTYPKGQTVLHDISFSVKPGEAVALVGRSGSGKTTLISLLSRFYEYSEGRILLDGFPIEEYQLIELRRQFALVSQNITLFHDTIYNNIAYGRPDCTDSEVFEAARASYVLDFVNQLPEGMNSLVGENGVLLSGGQRQRIAMARAILKNSPILILDEATASLDTESERFIQRALENLMQSRTTLIIAHRLSTVEGADKIIVLDNGRIIEQGTHGELLNQNGQYAKLYNMQFKESPHLVDTAHVAH